MWLLKRRESLLLPRRLNAQEFMRSRGVRRPLEVETRTLGELHEVLALLDSVGGASMISRVMLDNMTRRDDAVPGERPASLWLASSVCGCSGSGTLPRS